MIGTRMFRTATIAFGFFVTACSHEVTGPIPSVDLPGDPDTARVRVVIPDGWELANIILALTNYGLANNVMIYKNGEYYTKVRGRFDRYRSIAAMKRLQLGNSDPVRRMYEFRENSVAYGFDHGRVVHGRRYSTLWHPDRFGALLAESQAFADASQFLTFFQEQQSYYAQTIARYGAIAQPDTMIAWFEREFERRYDHYTIAISPLIYGSHSAWSGRTPRGHEAVVFVSGPDVDGGSSASAGVRQAQVQRIVLTEIDHLFVNPVTDTHGAAVDRAFSNRAKWTTDGSSFYSSPRAVFNEYMTWAVALLYLQGRMSAADFETMNASTVRLMENSRGFIRFGAFNTKMLELWGARASGLQLTDLYPTIIQWAATQ